jgi:hypothetical protein
MMDNRKITHGVRMADGRVITEVDDLADEMTPELQKRLEDAGSIEGDWKGRKAAPKSDDKTAKK